MQTDIKKSSLLKKIFIMMALSLIATGCKKEDGDVSASINRTITQTGEKSFTHSMVVSTSPSYSATTTTTASGSYKKITLLIDTIDYISILNVNCSVLNEQTPNMLDFSIVGVYHVEVSHRIYMFLVCYIHLVLFLKLRKLFHFR